MSVSRRRPAAGFGSTVQRIAADGDHRAVQGATVRRWVLISTLTLTLTLTLFSTPNLTITLIQCTSKLPPRHQQIKPPASSHSPYYTRHSHVMHCVQTGCSFNCDGVQAQSPPLLRQLPRTTLQRQPRKQTASHTRRSIRLRGSHGGKLNQTMAGRPSAQPSPATELHLPCSMSAQLCLVLRPRSIYS